MTDEEPEAREKKREEKRTAQIKAGIRIAYAIDKECRNCKFFRFDDDEKPKCVYEQPSKVTSDDATCHNFKRSHKVKQEIREDAAILKGG